MNLKFHKQVLCLIINVIIFMGFGWREMDFPLRYFSSAFRVQNAIIEVDFFLWIQAPNFD